MDTLLVVGNSHVWTVCGWTGTCARDSTPISGSFDGLEVLGLAVTGGTAHNLSEPSSSTGAGRKVAEFLREKGAELGGPPVLSVFGDVDLRSHVVNEEMLGHTLARYCSYLRGLVQDGSIGGRLLVSSVTGAHSVLEDVLARVLLWNALLRGSCAAEGWTYVDLFTPFIGTPSVDGNNHLGDAEGAVMRSAVLDHLGR